MRFRLHREMEVTGELYWRLRIAGLDAHLETRVVSDVHPSGEMRVDIGIVDGESLVAVIECKKDGQKFSFWSRQARAYRDLGKLVRIHFVNDEESMIQCIAAELKAKTRLAA